MRLKFSLRELQTFVAIADNGTFAAAGERIGLSQSAISLQIKSLETALETELFDRSKRPPIMNAQGLTLVKRAREIINQCQALTDDLHESPLGGRLRLGVIPTVMSGILPAALQELRQSHPHIMVKLTSGLSAQLVSQVNKGHLDAAIVTQPAQLGRGFSWHAFAEEPLVVIAPLDAKGLEDHEALTRYPFIQFHPETYAGQLIDGLLKDRGIAVDTRMNLDSLEAIAKMVANGLGVSIVPQRTIEKPFPEGVTVMNFGTQSVKRVVGIVERIENPKLEFIQILNKTLMAQVKRDEKHN